VTITDSTSGSTIYYTTDGSAPTTNSTKYIAPITVSATETIHAIAAAPGDTNSAVASATYTINATTQTVATPVFSPAGGTFTSAQTVTISDSTSGATIYYTTNGSAPTTSSTKYTGPIAVSATETIEAIGAATGDTNSAVAMVTYTINIPTQTVATPTLSPVGGTFTSAQTVTISDSTVGATVYYTTNDTTPTTSSIPYTGPITVSSTETIEAFGVAPGDDSSAVVSATYTINISNGPAATPAFSPAPGSYTGSQTVTISDSTSGATVYYTTDGTIPTTSSTKYSTPVTIANTETLSALAVASGYQSSAVGTGVYTINPGTPGFAIVLSAASLTVNAGSSGTDTLTVSPQFGFNQAVSLSCSGLPSGASCAFNPTTVTPSGSSVTDQLSVAVASGTAQNHSSPIWPGAGGIAVAVCLLTGFRRRKAYKWLLLCLLLLSICSGVSSCGGKSGGSGSSGGGPSTSIVTVNATSGSLQSSTTFSLTIP
jgi:hypothetical protein